MSWNWGSLNSLAQQLQDKLDNYIDPNAAPEDDAAQAGASLEGPAPKPKSHASNGHIAAGITDANVAQVLSENRELRDTVQVLENQNIQISKEYRRLLQEKEKEVVQLRASIDSSMTPLANELEAQNAAIVSLRAELSEKTSRVVQLEASVASLKAEGERQEGIVRGLNTKGELKFNKLKAQAKAKIQALQDELDKVKGGVSGAAFGDGFLASAPSSAPGTPLKVTRENSDEDTSDGGDAVAQLKELLVTSENARKDAEARLGELKLELEKSREIASRSNSESPVDSEAAVVAAEHAAGLEALVASLQAELASLRLETAAARAESAALKDDVRVKDEHAHRMQSALERARKDRDAASATMEEKDALVVDLEAEVTRLKSEVASLGASLTSASEGNDDALSRARATAAEATVARETAESALKEASDRIAALTTELEGAFAARETSESGCKTAESALKEASDRIAALTTELEGSSAAREMSESGCKTAESALKEASDRIAALTSELEEVRVAARDADVVDTARKDGTVMDGLQAQLTAAETLVDQLRASVVTAEERSVVAESTVETLHAQLNSLKEEYDAVLVSVRAELQDALNLHSELIATNASLKDRLDAAESAASGGMAGSAEALQQEKDGKAAIEALFVSAQSERASVEARLEDASARIVELEGLLEDARTKAREADERGTSDKAATLQLEAQLHASSARVAQLEREVGELHHVTGEAAEVERLREAGWEKRAIDAEAALSDAEKRASDALNELARTSREFTELQATLAAAKEEGSRAASEVEQLRDEMDDTRALLTKAEAAQEAAVAALTSARKEWSERETQSWDDLEKATAEADEAREEARAAIVARAGLESRLVIAEDSLADALKAREEVISRVALLEEHLASKDDNAGGEVQRLGIELATITTRCEGLTAELNAATTEAARLSGELAAAADEHEKSVRQLAEANAEITRLSAELLESTSTVESLRALEAQLSARDSAEADLRSALLAKDVEVTALKEQIETTGAAIKRANEERDALSLESESAASELSALKEEKQREMDDLRATIGELQANARVLEQTMGQSAHAAAEETAQREAALRAELALRETAVWDAQEESGRLSRQLADTQVQLAKISEELNARVEALSEKAKEESTLRADAEGELERERAARGELQRKTQEYISERSEAERRLHELVLARDSMDAAVVSERDARVKAEAEVARLAEAYAGVAAEKDALLARATEAEHSLTESARHVTRLEASVRSAHEDSSRAADYAGRLQDAEERVYALTRELDETISRKEEMEGVLHDARVSAQRGMEAESLLRGELTTARAQIADLMASLSSREQDVAKMEEELDELRLEKENGVMASAPSAAVSRAQVEAAETALAEAVRERDAGRSTVAQLQSKIEQLSSELSESRALLNQQQQQHGQTVRREASVEVQQQLAQSQQQSRALADRLAQAEARLAGAQRSAVGPPDEEQRPHAASGDQSHGDELTLLQRRLAMVEDKSRGYQREIDSLNETLRACDRRRAAAEEALENYATVAGSSSSTRQYDSFEIDIPGFASDVNIGADSSHVDVAKAYASKAVRWFNRQSVSLTWMMQSRSRFRLALLVYVLFLHAYVFTCMWFTTHG